MTDEKADVFESGCVTIEGLEAEFGIKRSTAYELMNSGRLPWTRPYGRRLIPRTAVRKLLATGLTGGSSAATVFSNGKNNSA